MGLLSRLASEGLIKSVQVPNINCKALFEGDTSEVEKARNYSNNQEFQPVSPENDLISRTTNCVEYVDKYGYIMHSLTEKEWAFPIAYSIVMYKDVLQVEHLLRAIYRPQNLYCIHVDLHSHLDVFSAMEGVAKCLPNVFLSDHRISVVWGEFSVLEVELICMEELFKKSKSWKYFINLTGQEFPLKTNAELVDILTAFNGSNDVIGNRRREWAKRFVNAGPAPHGLKPAKGQVHVVVTRDYVDFLLHDQRARDLLNWTIQTDVPDETFFPTLNLNPSLRIPGSYKYENYKNRKDSFVLRFKTFNMTGPCKGRVVRGICILGIDYLAELSRTETLFANKFIWAHERISLQCLEELLYNRTRDAYKSRSVFDTSWYSSLDFVVNKI